MTDPAAAPTRQAPKAPETEEELAQLLFTPGRDHISLPQEFDGLDVDPCLAAAFGVQLNQQGDTEKQDDTDD